jgi:uncharacterized ion transporter superfamily protein YfcC
MKRGFKKKGLSPVIATVLLVFLVLIVIAIIILAARGFFQEQLEKNGDSVENQCRNVKLRVDIASRLATEIELEIRNDGEIGVYGIEVKEIKGGSEKPHFNLLNIGAGESMKTLVNLEIRDLEKIVIYPVLLGGVVGGDENKEFTCVENPTVVAL